MDGKHILQADPYVLANAVIMRVLGRDVVAYIKAQLRTKGEKYADTHSLHLLQPVVLMAMRSAERRVAVNIGTAWIALWWSQMLHNQKHMLTHLKMRPITSRVLLPLLRMNRGR